MLDVWPSTESSGVDPWDIRDASTAATGSRSGCYSVILVSTKLQPFPDSIFHDPCKLRADALASLLVRGKSRG